MKTLLLYLCFAVYMFGAIFKKLKLNYLRKHVSEAEAEKYLYRCVKGWTNFIIKYLGLNVTVKGMENIPEESCLFVANHQGAIDIPLIMAYANKIVGFIAKKEILKLKFISSWMKEIHCVFMDRSNIRESVKSINEGVEELKAGHSLVIFPEGTRSKGPVLGEFKKGSMKLATKSGVPIVPVTIDGSYKAREGNKNGRLSKADVTITFSKPIYTDKLSREEQNELTDIVKSTIAKGLSTAENKIVE